jgi:hypothetical protein
MATENLTAEEVGALFGKSRSHVYARIKLLDLCPDARDALQAGDLDASKALLLARLTSPKLQIQALPLLLGDHVRHSRAAANLKDRFLQPLDRAPWPLDAHIAGATDKLIAKGLLTSPCADCPHNTANDTELQADVGTRPLCAGGTCYDIKVDLFYRAKKDEALAAGKTIVSGDAARARVVNELQSAAHQMGKEAAEAGRAAGEAGRKAGTTMLLAEKAYASGDVHEARRLMAAGAGASKSEIENSVKAMAKSAMSSKAQKVATALKGYSRTAATLGGMNSLGFQSAMTEATRADTITMKLPSEAVSRAQRFGVDIAGGGWIDYTATNGFGGPTRSRIYCQP